MDSIFNLDEFKGYANRWHARQRELARRKGYYDGSVYKGIRDAFSSTKMLTPRLYRGIKTLYLPLFRAVQVDAGIIPGDWAWEEEAPDAWEAARAQIFDWSDWRRRGVLYCHYGACFGVTGLRVADLRNRGQVQLLPVSPEYFMLVETGQYDTAPTIAFWLEQREADGETVEYAEVITPDLVRTYWDGKPTGIEGRDPEYPNELGFVPFVETRHIESGDPLGECTYQMAIPLLDEVNQLASYLGDIIAKHAEPQWVISGAEASDLVKSGDNVWFLPTPGAKAEPLVAGVDIAGVMGFIDAIAANVTSSLPELAFDELKTKTQIATATIELQLMELVLKVKRCRPNYDQGLIDALRMAGRAAASMGLSDIAVLDDEALALDSERPVLPVSRLDEIAIEQAELGLEASRRLASGDSMTRAQNGGIGDGTGSGQGAVGRAE